MNSGESGSFESGSPEALGASLTGFFVSDGSSIVSDPEPFSTAILTAFPGMPVGGVSGTLQISATLRAAFLISVSPSPSLQPVKEALARLGATASNQPAGGGAQSNLMRMRM